MVKKRLLSIMGAVVMLGVLGGPASAVDPAPARVFLLNGIPMRVDICFGRTEAVSNLRYTQAVLWQEIPPGTYRFVIRRARAGACTGARLAVINKTFGEAGNYSLVIWKPFRRVLMKLFENDVTLDSAEEPTITIRHVARMPAMADVWVWQHVPARPAVLEPTINDLRRGRGSDPIAIPYGQFAVDIYASRRTRFFQWEGIHTEADYGTTTDVYLIGTGLRNYTVVAYWQDGIVAAP